MPKTKTKTKTKTKAKAKAKSAIAKPKDRYRNHPDVRLSVVDRLVDSTDERVAGALSRAMESDHEDLRLKAALALARRGEMRTADVLMTNWATRRITIASPGYRRTRMHSSATLRRVT